MNFREFVKLFQNTPIIESGLFSLYGNPEDLRRQVLRWTKKKYLHVLKKGIYVLSDEYKKTKTSPLFAANQLLSPSYISMEYALGKYGLIPEKVEIITSITTKKTQSYENIFGRFEYKSISKKLFFGMIQETTDQQKYFIALPEKAVLDFFYFNYEAKPDFAYFESLRLQNMESLNKKTLAEYSTKYNKRVQDLINSFLKYILYSKNKFKTL
ncbi:MAG: hypothetical protein ABII74_07545 [Elusimicrobiota bacterium]